MAITQTVTKINFRINLDNGTDADGNVKTVAVSLPALSVSGYDDAKAIAVATALDNLLTKTIYSFSKVVTTTLAEE